MKRTVKFCIYVTLSAVLTTCLLLIPLKKEYYDRVTGRCSCWTSVHAMETSTHWCSVAADSRGQHQKVISYSLYGNSSDMLISDRYFQLLDALAESIAHYYPGWAMRIYHKFKVTDLVSMPWLCKTHCRYPNVDLCNVREIRDDPEVQRFIDSEDLDKMHPSMWRFLAAADPSVDLFLSRDIDSEIIDREVAAVDQWLSSNETFHVMRDHQYHSVVMLAGLWGAKLHQKRERIRDIVVRMIQDGGEVNRFTDQILLGQHLWPVARHDVMAHDSYNCQSKALLKLSAQPMFPFPTQRSKANDFVGNIITAKEKLRNALKPCPVTCRPREHPDWQFC